MAVQIFLPILQVGCWQRGFRLASPAPQKKHTTANSNHANSELNIFICFAKSLILYLLTLYVSFLVHWFSFSWKILIFLSFWVRQLKSKSLHPYRYQTDIIPFSRLVSNLLVLHMVSASLISVPAFSFHVPPTKGGSRIKAVRQLFILVTVSSHTTITTQLIISVFE